jgi:glutamine amidotransferase
MRQQLLAKIAPNYFANILGSTDSEVMFHLALTLGLEEDVPSAIAAMVREVEATAKENGVNEALWMTLGISDGRNLWGFRYGSDEKGPTLYISPGMEEINRINPEIARKLGRFAACLVSEPIGNYQDTWKLIAEQSHVFIGGAHIQMSEFDVKE